MTACEPRRWVRPGPPRRNQVEPGTAADQEPMPMVRTPSAPRRQQLAPSRPPGQQQQRMADRPCRPSRKGDVKAVTPGIAGVEVAVDERVGQAAPGQRGEPARQAHDEGLECRALLGGQLGRGSLDGRCDRLAQGRTPPVREADGDQLVDPAQPRTLQVDQAGHEVGQDRQFRAVQVLARDRRHQDPRAVVPEQRRHRLGLEPLEDRSFVGEERRHDLEPRGTFSGCLRSSPGQGQPPHAGQVPAPSLLRGAAASETRSARTPSAQATSAAGPPGRAHDWRSGCSSSRPGQGRAAATGPATSHR